MPNFKRKNSDYLTVSIGDMNKRIQVPVRMILPGINGSVDYQEGFEEIQTFWALIETVQGEQIFDGTNQIENITHKFYIRWRPNMSIQKWVDWNGQRFRIINVENESERNQYYILHCNVRGNQTITVNKD